MNKPQHPGVFLKDVIRTIPMTGRAFADHVEISRVALSRILNAKAKVTAAMSIKISQAFGQKQGDHWFKLQTEYDFARAAHLAKKRKKIGRLRMRKAMKLQ